MENWRSYKFFDGWIMKKIEHTYNFNFKNKYRLNQPISECKYTYCCDSLDNSLSLCEETSFYSSETSNVWKDRRRLRRKRRVKRLKRHEDRHNYSSSSEGEEECRYRRRKYQRIFIHQKIIYEEYVSKKCRKFYPTRLKMLSQERWNENKENVTRRKEKEEKDEKTKGNDKEEKMEKDEGKDPEKEEMVLKEEGTSQFPPLPLAQPPLPPLPPPPPPPPPPALPPAVRLVAVGNGGYMPLNQMAATTDIRQYNEQHQQQQLQQQQQQQLPFGAITGIAYEIPVDIRYIIGCNAVFRQF